MKCACIREREKRKINVLGLVKGRTGRLSVLGLVK